jgi:hypothetical protein
MATESFGWGCSLPEALRNIELTPESPSSHQLWLGKRLATGWLRTNHLYAEAQVAVFPSGIGTIRGSAGRTRTYNQWINSHAQIVQPVLMGVGKWRFVYLFEPYVLADAVPCGLVWLTNGYARSAVRSR